MGVSGVFFLENSCSLLVVSCGGLLYGTEGPAFMAHFAGSGQWFSLGFGVPLGAQFVVGRGGVRFGSGNGRGSVKLWK